MRNGPIALIVGVLAALALVACGGSGNSDEEDQISAAIDKAATSGDPAACTEVETQNFLQQTSGGGGGSAQQAVQQCERDAKDSVADTVDVSDIEVDGDSATANAAVAGSIFDGQTLQIALVKDGDQWKLDQFKGFEDFDRASMNSAFKKEISTDPETPPAAADCVNQQIESVSDQDLQGLFVGGDPKAEQAVFGPCGKYFKGQ
jgi:hypothetical protein